MPPLIGFFAKQMVLSAAIDSGFVFLTLIAILTSVVSAVYYLSVIKQVFFDEHENKLKPDHGKFIKLAYITSYLNNTYEISLKINNITLSYSLTITISIFSLILLSFALWGKSFIRSAIILTLIMFNL